MRFQNLKVVDHWRRKCTPPKTNMEPENTPLEEEKHLQTTNFWVPCWFSGEYIITVDGSLKSGINSPVEGKVVEIYHYFSRVFVHIQTVVGNGISAIKRYMTTLPETNILAPENGLKPQKETIVFQASIFRCYVSFREGIVQGSGFMS